MKLPAMPLYAEARGAEARDFDFLMKRWYFLIVKK
jgi:hypothetical protein